MILFLFPAIILSAQNNPKLDSMMIELNKVQSDTGRIMLFYKISHELQFVDINKSIEYAENAYAEAQRLGFKKGLAYSQIQLGNIEQIKAEYSNAESYNLSALKLLEKLEDEAGEAICYNNLGIIEHSRNDYSKALEYYRQSLSLNRELRRNSGEAVSLFCIGTVFENMAQYDSALQYYLEGQIISERINDSKLKAYAKISLANVYFSMKDYLKAYDYNIEASEIYIKTGNKLGLIKVYGALGQLAVLRDSLDIAQAFYQKSLEVSRSIMSNNDISLALYSMANVFEQRGIFDSAYVYYKQAYTNFSSEGNLENAAHSLISMARIENMNENFTSGEKLLMEATEIAEEIGAPTLLQQVYYERALCYSGKSDYKQAFHFLQSYSDLKDSVMSIEKQNQILDLQTRYETERKEKENKILKQEQKILELTRNFLIGGAFLLALTAFFIFRSLILKKRDNALLRKQKLEITHQKEIVEEQKKEITDSIRYALRIQSAILPSPEIVNDIGAELFVLYLPRDIVSGDFYLFARLDENSIIICVADCTGHGVPGAFMSMLGMSLLSDIIANNKIEIAKGSYTPADILNKLRDRVKLALRQTGKEGENKDGMDMSVITLNLKSHEMQYAGANNSVYIVTNGVLEEIKALRNPIGIYIEEKPFVNTVRQVQQGAVIYLFSDGYSDQINEKGSKFLSKNLKKFLEENAHLPIKEQEEILLQKHLSYKGSEEQVDDILLIGVKVP